MVMFSFNTLRVSLSWPGAAVAAALLFCGADAFQRKVLPPPIEKRVFHLKLPNSHTVFHPERGVLRGVVGESHLTINSLGIRGPELPPRPGSYRILCVGDSITECLYLDDQETWPARIMERLNQEKNMPRVWVGNAGQSAYSCVHHLQFLREWEHLREMDCIVFMVGAADLSYALTGAPEVLEKPVRKKKRKSYIETFLKDVRGKFKEKKIPSMAIEDLKGEVHIARRKARMEAEKCDVLPDLSEPIRRFRQHLRDMVEICRRNNVRPVFVSLVSSYRKDLPPEDRDVLWGGKLADGRYLTERALREVFDLYNKAVGDVAREIHAEWVDTSPLHEQPKLFYDGNHFNEEGARRLGGLVADYFVAHRSGDHWQPAPRTTRSMPAN